MKKNLSHCIKTHDNTQQYRQLLHKKIFNPVRISVSGKWYYLYFQSFFPPKAIFSFIHRL